MPGKQRKQLRLPILPSATRNGETWGRSPPVARLAFVQPFHKVKFIDVLSNHTLHTNRGYQTPTQVLFVCCCLGCEPATHLLAISPSHRLVASISITRTPQLQPSSPMIRPCLRLRYPCPYPNSLPSVSKAVLTGHLPPACTATMPESNRQRQICHHTRKQQQPGDP
jgi:hypothetical protein